MLYDSKIDRNLKGKGKQLKAQLKDIEKKFYFDNSDIFLLKLKSSKSELNLSSPKNACNEDKKTFQKQNLDQFLTYKLHNLKKSQQQILK